MTPSKEAKALVITIAKNKSLFWAINFLKKELIDTLIIPIHRHIKLLIII